MNRPRQFPRWLQRIIVGAAIFGGAWYMIGGWVAWASQLAG